MVIILTLVTPANIDIKYLFLARFKIKITNCRKNRRKSNTRAKRFLLFILTVRRDVIFLKQISRNLLDFSL